MTLGSTLIDWRRELHQHPELSLQEEATTARIHAWLHAADVVKEKMSSRCGRISTRYR